MYKIMNNITSMFSSSAIKETAVIYARCSTLSQNQDKGTSLHTQTAECMNYCKQHNFEILEVISEVVSGHNGNKQTYNTILEKYKNTNVIISDPSRLSRNIVDATKFLDNCNKNKNKVHSVRDNIVCDSPYNSKLFTNLIYDAMIESNTISKRIRSSINIRRKMGSHIGMAPYGYNIKHVIDLNTGMKMRKLVENPNEMKIIKLINLMYYGSTSKQFYTALYNVDSDCTYKLEDNNGFPIDIIYYGNVWPFNIAAVLNECNIDYRDKKWNSNLIKNIVRRYPNSKKC